MDEKRDANRGAETAMIDGLIREKDRAGSPRLEASRPMPPSRFASVSPNLEQSRAMNVVRLQFEGLEKLIGNFIAPSYSVVRALEKLEEAHMLLNKAITHEGTI